METTLDKTPGKGGDKKLKGLSVTQRYGKFYYPKSIPRERGNLATIICSVICIVLFIVDIFTNDKNIQALIMLYACGFTTNFLMQFLYRITLVCEEWRHFASRYNMSYMTLLKDSLYFSVHATFCMVLCIIYIVYFITSSPQDNFHMDLNFFICLVPSVYLLGKIFELSSSTLNDSLLISQIHGLDYGSGMAYSFFYGYLKLVLPKTGREDKNLRELMQDYEDQNRIKFQSYKLFILIPISLKCFVSLKNGFSPSVDESQSLNEKVITVAGVRNRSYKNAVYKITKNNKKTYVSAEYATPLKTFNDVLENTGDHSVHYRKHKHEISLQFYLTLKRVLQSTGLDEFCELIFFEDSYQNPDDSSTEYYDVGDIILNRLKEMKKYREKME